MLMRDAAGTLLNTERTREFAVLKALADTAVPAPKVHWIDAQGRWLGAPSVVMERMPGTCDYMILNGAGSLEARLALARGFIELMANIHAVDWRAQGLADSLGTPDGAPSLRELAHWEAEYRQVQLEPHPELDYVLAWLKRRAPEAEAIVLVHGDFKPGNALIEDGRITRQARLGDRAPGRPARGPWLGHQPGAQARAPDTRPLGTRQIVAAYRELTGRSVREADLRWWNVFSCWKLSVIQLTAVTEFVAGRYNRVFQTPTWLFRPMFQMMETAS